MFGFFKKKTEVDRLNEAYKKCLEEAFKLSSIDRRESDKKYKEADDILKKIELLIIK